MRVQFLAVDGFNFVRRIFEARRPQSSEDLQGVVEAAKSSLQRAIDKFSPSHAAFVLEEHDRTWRHLLLSSYKANRSPTPELLLNSLDDFVDGFSQLGVMSCQVPSYEADDVIGTIASVVARHGGDVVILSTDKVYLQLVSDHIRIVDHFHGKTWKAQDIQDKYGVRVDQYADYLALVGDKSNNVKGVPGIGPKSAVQLLSVYGDLEGLLVAESEDKQVVKVQLALDDVRRCRQLAQLKTDVELGRNLKSFRLRPPTKE